MAGVTWTSVEEPADLATWENCAIVSLFVSPPGCPVGLASSPKAVASYDFSSGWPFFGGASRLGAVAAPFAGWPCEWWVLESSDMKEMKLVVARDLEVGRGVEDNAVERPHWRGP